MSGASGGNQTSSDEDGSDDFPIAAIVCLAVGAYVVLIIGIVILKQYCTSKGSCKSECCNAKTEEEGGCCSCNFCAKANEACPCCCKCNVDGCLSKICGKPKKINCIDVLLCNCGGCTERTCNSFKCCGCCPRDLQCQCSCSGGGLCTDCCSGDDDFEPGTCGCLCLEVKIRSPRRGGSSRRSTSAPPSFRQKNAHSRQFNTHSGPGENTTSSIISNGKLSSLSAPSFRRRKHSGDDGAGDFVIVRRSSGSRGSSNRSSFSNNNNNTINNSNSNSNNIRLRSSSHSPKLLSTTRGNKQAADLYNVKSQRSSDISPALVGESVYSRGKSRPLPAQQKSTVEKSAHDSSDYSNNNVIVDSARTTSSRRKSSKLRKSIRSGQRSQRFPTQTLVSAESLNNCNASSGQFDAALKSQGRGGRSLPVPSSGGGRRPLPAISKQANKTR